MKRTYQWFFLRMRANRENGNAGKRCYFHSRGCSPSWYYNKNKWWLHLYILFVSIIKSWKSTHSSKSIFLRSSKSASIKSLTYHLLKSIPKPLSTLSMGTLKMTMSERWTWLSSNKIWVNDRRKLGMLPDKVLKEPACRYYAVEHRNRIYHVFNAYYYVLNDKFSPWGEWLTRYVQASVERLLLFTGITKLTSRMETSVWLWMQLIHCSLGRNCCSKTWNITVGSSATWKHIPIDKFWIGNPNYW